MFDFTEKIPLGDCPVVKTPASLQTLSLVGFDYGVQLSQQTTFVARMLVDGQAIKYIMLKSDEAGTCGGLVEEDLPGVLGPVWPDGDWDGAVYEFKNGSAKFVSIACGIADEYPDLARVVDQSSLTVVERIGGWGTRVQLVTCPAFPNKALVYKFAAFPEQQRCILREAQIYASFTDDRFAPGYCADVYHGGRVIGFLLEHIAGDKASAEPRFKRPCLAALRLLHEQGILLNSQSANGPLSHFIVPTADEDEDGVQSKPFQNTAIIVGFDDSHDKAAPKDLVQEYTMYKKLFEAQPETVTAYDVVERSKYDIVERSNKRVRMDTDMADEA